MILLANCEAEAGFSESITDLKNGKSAVDALVRGIGFVEADPKVRSVGYGGWPNMLGVMECDAGVMDGTTRAVGTVAAVPRTLHVAALACEVMRRLPHVMLTGEGARRFADEIGFTTDDMLYPDSKRVWWEKLDGLMTEEQKGAFPDTPLAGLLGAITDPERVRDTTVFLGQDQTGGIATVTSTSGWAWKYPGRVGDSPIPGAGFYADSRYGAAACTHTGEMTMRSATAHAIVHGMKCGLSLDDAIQSAADDLLALDTGFIGEVVIHALDTHGNHRVVNLHGQGTVAYWFWEPSMAAPEKRQSQPI
ncbi:isoaspartyl peptidase/L-asparaginase [Nitratireductor aquimarinus]|uniref:isoaspartyl peptidase/L-asparaginase n=1 Tax=Nitratireductor aquimarinus TaxID=889300 RepID=UPI0029362B3F|nr:isoaspartyl peptidase/L-asparaginase [Nitratireductor aquimarinus]MDV2967544.1 isoaspartyl peptidase/L-asparaginase [Nitratireductor aquimarinus]